MSEDTTRKLEEKILREYKQILYKVIKSKFEGWNKEGFIDKYTDEEISNIVNEIYDKNKNVMFKKSYLNLDEFEVKLEILITKIQEKYNDFDIILGIPRGGIILATMISYLFDTKSNKIDKKTPLVFIPNKYPYRFDNYGYPILEINENDYKFLENKKILLVDDGILLGKTIEKYINLLNQLKVKSIKIAVLNYNSLLSSIQPDFYAIKTDILIQYPWKYFSDPLFAVINNLDFDTNNESNIVIELETLQKISFIELQQVFLTTTFSDLDVEITKQNQILLTSEKASFMISLMNNKIIIKLYPWIHEQEKIDIEHLFEKEDVLYPKLKEIMSEYKNEMDRILNNINNKFVIKNTIYKYRNKIQNMNQSFTDEEVE